MMPVFDCARVLPAAIDSIIAQSFRDWELIIVDDGSTDGSLEIAREAARRDERIRVFSIPHAGRGVARNECLRHVRGRYVAACDSDDISLPERFATQVDLLETHPRVDVVCCHESLAFSTDPDDTFRIAWPRTEEAIRRTFDRHRMGVQHASVMMRAALFERYGGYDEQLHRAQDLGFFLRIYRDVSFMTTRALILYRTGNLVVSRRHLTENNLYRYYAVRRARGEQASFDRFYRRPVPRLYRHLVVPATYLWYLLKRRVLRIGVRA